MDLGACSISLAVKGIEASRKLHEQYGNLILVDQHV